MTSLDELDAGTTGRIRHVGGERAFRRRMMEIGLVPGTPIERLGAMASGDPIRFRVRHAVVALRRRDASLVDVEVG